MKKDSKTVNNIYFVLDNEMERLHQLINMYAAHAGKYPSAQSYDPYTTQMLTASKRLFEMQTVLIEAFKAHEPAIQEKVAELALTGGDDEQ